MSSPWWWEAASPLPCCRSAVPPPEPVSSTSGARRLWSETLAGSWPGELSGGAGQAAAEGRDSPSSNLHAALREADRRAEPPIEDRGEPRDLCLQRVPRRLTGLPEPGDAERMAVMTARPFGGLMWNGYLAWVEAAEFQWSSLSVRL
jgi:hypothetical protein